MILVGTVLSTGQVVTLYRFGLRLSKVRPNGPKPSGTTPSGPPPPEVRTSSYQLTKRGRALFKRLPQAVREGLDEPYGDKFDAAWQGLSVIAPAEQRQWINRLASRNYDLTSFVAAAFSGLFVGLSAHVQTGTYRSLGFSYAMMCLTSYLRLGCFAIVGRAAVSVIEVLAIHPPPLLAEARPNGESPPNSI